MKKNRAGFTLVELLAVIVVLGIIMVIAVPSVLKTVNSTKRDSFYLYAESLQSKAISKYIQDSDDYKNKSDCAVYDIGKDLGSSNTGNYEGWVKVKREAASSGKRVIDAVVSNDNGIFNIKYCLDTDNCTPYESVFIAENEKSTTVSKTLEQGQVMCIQYEYPNKITNVVERSSISCYKYEDGRTVLDTYKYYVYMTLKDNNYAVEELLFNDDMNKEKFDKAIDTFANAHKSDANKLKINSPVCSINDTVTDKGTSTVSSTLITSSPETTTIDINDITLLLSNISIEGYENYISFSPYQFEYVLNVPNNTTSLKVTATAKDPTASSVTIKGNENFLVGTNSIIINVHNNNTNKESNYRINVRRLNENGQIVTEPISTSTTTASNGKPDPMLESSNASLQSLIISGYLIDFEPNNYDYELKTSGEKSLFIDYKTKSLGAEVVITGNENLKNGSVIKILVTSENKYYSKEYVIKIKVEDEKSDSKIYLKIILGVLLLIFIVLVVVIILKKPRNVTMRSNN